MPDGDPILCNAHAEKTARMPVSDIRKWWIEHELDKWEPSDPNREEDKVEEDRRRKLCEKLNRALRTTLLLIDLDGGRPVLRLKAAPDRFNIPSVLHPRWPVECEVISDIIHHIEWDPPEPEPFYQPTGHERAPMSAGNEIRKVVYRLDHATKHPYFSCSYEKGSKGPIKSARSFDVHQSDITLEFESRFESGNLQKAVHVGIHDYELTLRTDLYTRKHTQWFYFRVRNMKAGVTYRFTIINLMKSSSLYSQGMKPLLYSETAAAQRGVGWQRTGSNIRYYRNYNQDVSSNADTLYSLTWTLQFPYDSDTCYLAHCYPYTYSRLQRYLERLSSNPAISSFCKLHVLCHSLARNAVHMLTITTQSVSREEDRRSKAVVVTARVHPGETNSSWMMEGFLDFLLGDTEDAQLLRDTFVFKVVPMLNPDGVVVGNYRCSLAGRDLNRMYKTSLRDSFPSVWHTRNMVERLMAESDVVLYCDFHGHNRKNNVFMYGCESRADSSPKLHERVFPLMMSKNADNKFSFKSCKFRAQKSKEGTGRITMWKLGITNSYTMEATFGGSTLGDSRGTHFTTRDLKSLGFHLCDTLLDYCDPDPAKVTNCLSELGVLMRKKVKEKLGRDLGADCNISVSDLESSTSGSNSSDSDGPPLHLLNRPRPVNMERTTVKKKKKRLRSRKERNRLQADRGSNNTQHKVLQSNITHMKTPERTTEKQLKSREEKIRVRMNNNTQTKGNVTNMEPDLPHEDRKRSIQEQPVGQFRRRWQENGLRGDFGIPPVSTHPGEISQVTLWQGCQPVKDASLITMQAAYLHHRPKACPHQRMYTPHTGQRRCSTQLLYLSPHAPNFPQSNQQQRQCPRPSYKSSKVCRGLQPSLFSTQRSPPMYIKKVSGVTPAEFRLSGFTSDTSRERNSPQVTGIVLEDSSHADTTRTKLQKKEPGQNSSKDYLSPQDELNQSDLSPDNTETESRRSLFVPVLTGRRLPRGTLRDKNPMTVLTPGSKPSGIMTLEVSGPQTEKLSSLQSIDIRQRRSGGEDQVTTAVKKENVSRSSQSAPPKNQMEIFV